MAERCFPHSIRAVYWRRRKNSQATFQLLSWLRTESTTLGGRISTRDLEAPGFTGGRAVRWRWRCGRRVKSIGVGRQRRAPLDTEGVTGEKTEPPEHAGGAPHLIGDRFSSIWAVAAVNVQFYGRRHKCRTDRSQEREEMKTCHISPFTFLLMQLCPSLRCMSSKHPSDRLYPHYSNMISS